MIAVIADDLTGAAELGGLGLQFNLSVEIDTEVNVHSSADLLVVATDTRSQSEAEAKKVMAKVTEEVSQLHPQLIYKKIDSVLRGHVVAEIETQLSVLNLKKALVIPSNPALDRIIKNGLYYFKGKPIHQSSFAQDPEFPISSSEVTEMLRAENTTVSVVNKENPLPETGIIIGEVENENDLHFWAKQITENTLLAGGAAFFSALLKTRKLPSSAQKPLPELKTQLPALFVCGTTFHKSRNAIKAEKAKGGPVSYMPKSIVFENHPSSHQLENWSKEISAFLQKEGTALIAIDPETAKNSTVSAASLRQKMAAGIEQVLHHNSVHELFIEGGSTAAAVLKQLGIHRFYPVKEMAPGVIRMRTDNDLNITLKPGSYDWPSAIWKFST